MYIKKKKEPTWSLLEGSATKGSPQVAQHPFLPKRRKHRNTETGSIPGSEGNGVGNGNPLQYSCLENSKDRGP